MFTENDLRLAIQMAQEMIWTDLEQTERDHKYTEDEIITHFANEKQA